MIPLSWGLAAGAAAISAAAGAWTGWQLRDGKAARADAARIAAEAEDARERRRTADAAAAAYAGEQAAQAAQTRVVTREVVRVVRTPFYAASGPAADCLDGDGLRIVSDAIAAGNRAAPAVAGASVPGAGGAGGRLAGDGAGVDRRDGGLVPGLRWPSGWLDRGVADEGPAR